MKARPKAKETIIQEAYQVQTTGKNLKHQVHSIKLKRSGESL